MTRALRIPSGEFHSWDGISQPPPWEWVRAKFRHVVGMPDDISSEGEDVVVAWRDYDFTEDFSYFVERARKLVGRYGDVRIVFGWC